MVTATQQIIPITETATEHMTTINKNVPLFTLTLALFEFELESGLSSELSSELSLD